MTRLSQLTDTAPDREAARERFVTDYLSTGHRDNPGDGCAAVALASDAGHRDPEDPLHRTYTAGLRAMANALRSLESDEPDDSGDAPDPGTLAELATLVGAVVLARATVGDAISERVLAAARDHLLRG